MFFNRVHVFFVCSSCALATSVASFNSTCLALFIYKSITAMSFCVLAAEAKWSTSTTTTRPQNAIYDVAAANDDDNDMLPISQQFFCEYDATRARVRSLAYNEPLDRNDDGAKHKYIHTEHTRARFNATSWPPQSPTIATRHSRKHALSI